MRCLWGQVFGRRPVDLGDLWKTLPETNSKKAPENGPSQKGTNRIPTIHFQVRKC